MGSARIQLKGRGGVAMKTISKKSGEGNEEMDVRRETRLAAIQALIPLGLKAVEDELQKDFLALVGRMTAKIMLAKFNPLTFAILI